MRDLRKKQFQRIKSAEDCSSLLDSLHKDDIKDHCPNKYLSTPCSKSYLRSKWETDKSPGFINP